MELLAGLQSSPKHAEKGGLWRIDGERLTCIEPSPTAPAIVLAPSEQILILAADLPLPSHRQRLAALPFAVEDRLAEPLEAVHVALGTELAPRRYLAAVVRRDLMRDWIARLDEAGLGRAAILPDALSLPLPDAGAWSVSRAGDRVLVRGADGLGFALPLALLASVWAGAGSPALVSYGDALPSDFPAEPAAPLRLTSWPSDRPIDLRQGVYADRGRPLGKLIRRLAVVAGAGALAHAAVAAADTAALQAIAHKRHDTALALLRQSAPNTPADADPVSTLDRLLPADGGGGGFLPLFARTAAALRPAASGLALRSLAYSARDGGLTLTVETADMAGLQRVEAALAAGGLNPSAGAATAESGRANGEFVVREPGRRR